MPLVARITNHSVRKFREAAHVRYNEALRLASADYLMGSIYLWGYSTEMSLKAAYFRFLGFGANDPITITDLNNAKIFATGTLGMMWPGNLHDLLHWAALLIQRRIHTGIPYPPVFANTLYANVTTIFANWREFLRYHPNRPRFSEMWNVYESATWIKQQYRRM